MLNTFKQSLSLPRYLFGSISHLFHQSWMPWINTSKKTMFRSWRLTLLLTLCTLVKKIWSHFSIGKWLTLMVCSLSSHEPLVNNLWQGETRLCMPMFRWFIGCIAFPLSSYLSAYRLICISYFYMYNKCHFSPKLSIYIPLTAWMYRIPVLQ